MHINHPNQRYNKPKPKQRYVFRKVPALVLTNPFTFPPSYDTERFRRSSSQHISLLSGCLSARLAQACAYMSQVAAYRIASQGALRLRLFCTHGTPVRKSLVYWPALPIVVEYGGLPALSPPTPEDEENIMVALKHTGRVISISLTITTSLLERLSTCKGTFSELQDLFLLSSQDGEPLIMPRTFRWGQRLRRFHSTRIAIPALLQPLFKFCRKYYRPSASRCFPFLGSNLTNYSQERLVRDDPAPITFTSFQLYVVQIPTSPTAIRGTCYSPSSYPH